jgi:beta-lactamase regulating signal transducer with metallopeptidase domain
MNSLLQVFTSPAWAHLVKALLHTLWIGAIFALLLALLLRRSSNPFLRYRLCLAALLATLFGGLISWSTLNQKTKNPTNTVVQISEANSPPEPIKSASASTRPTTASAPSSPVGPTRRPATNWIPWLALLWLTGASLMLLRAAAQVARAESFRRRTKPLTDPAILALVEQARKQLNILRRIRIVASEQLTSSAVIGILVPTLIFPLSLLTTLPANQLQLIILHELAHVRRDDYLANLCQLLIEAILFFNPTVWWISRQMRIEREACCDALAHGLVDQSPNANRTRSLLRRPGHQPRPRPRRLCSHVGSRRRTMPHHSRSHSCLWRRQKPFQSQGPHPTSPHPRLPTIHAPDVDRPARLTPAWQCPPVLIRSRNSMDRLRRRQTPYTRTAHRSD